MPTGTRIPQPSSSAAGVRPGRSGLSCGQLTDFGTFLRNPASKHGSRAGPSNGDDQSCEQHGSAVRYFGCGIGQLMRRESRYWPSYCPSPVGGCANNAPMWPKLVALRPCNGFRCGQQMPIPTVFVGNFIIWPNGHVVSPGRERPGNEPSLSGHADAVLRPPPAGVGDLPPLNWSTVKVSERRTWTWCRGVRLGLRC